MNRQSIANKLSIVLSKNSLCGNVLKSCIDEKISVLGNISCEQLISYFSSKIKSKNTLLSFLYSLLDEPDDRYIKLPHYNNIGKRKLKDNEYHIEDNGKYGILLNIISNKKTFNFSVRLKDMTIIKYNYELRKQERGSFRSFTLTDKYGNIGENWKVLKVLQLHEARKIFDNHDKHDIKTFDKFVDNELANEFFELPYFTFKCYINRLVKERDYWIMLRNKAEERSLNYDYEYEKNQLKKEGYL